MSLLTVSAPHKEKSVFLAALAAVILFCASPVAIAEDGAKDYASIYQRSCFACHSTGAAGAPLKGDTENWNGRIEARGMDGLVEVAIKGNGAMPAGGLCGDCTPEDMRALIEYMIE